MAAAKTVYLSYISKNSYYKYKDWKKTMQTCSSVQGSQIQETALLCSLVLVITVVLKCRWVWSIRRKIMTTENPSTHRKTSPTAALSTTNLTQTGLGSKRGLPVEGLATDHLGHGMAYDWRSERTSISNVPWFWRIALLFEGSQASPICLSGKSSNKVKMSMDHWCTNSDGEKLRSSEKILVQCHVLWCLKKKMKIFLYLMLPDFWNRVAFWMFPGIICLSF